MSTFKIILITVFSVSIVVGIGAFAMSKAKVPEGSANLVVWGTISDEAFQAALAGSSLKTSDLITMTYLRKDPTTFDTEFVEKLADGTGPDIVILRDDAVYKHRNRLFTIPYKNYTERTFKDTFIEQGEMFLSPEGVVAVPFIVNPLVMYWNRDLFSNNLIPLPPKYWDEFYNTEPAGLISKITHRDGNANITQSAVSLGEWGNITNAKEIISMLLLQAGTPVTVRANIGGSASVISALNYTYDYPVAPSISAINFYTQFSNPTSPSYTWNRSLPASLNYFLSGNLATYIGFASEIFNIQQKNPNLNFDVTYVPQIRPKGTLTPKQAVFGRMYALAIVKQSKQVAGSYSAIMALTEPTALTSLETVTHLPPVRRALLGAKPTDASQIVFYNSALISKGWIDPDGAKSSVVFRDMIESITSGRARLSESLQRANDSLNLLFK